MIGSRIVCGEFLEIKVNGLSEPITFSKKEAIEFMVELTNDVSEISHCISLLKETKCQ